MTVTQQPGDRSMQPDDRSMQRDVGSARSPSRPSPGARAARLTRTFIDKVLLERIRAGRLHDTGWPDGLRGVVTAAITCFVVALLLVVLSTPLRRWLPLLTDDAAGYTMPRATLWIVVFLIVFTLALWQSATLHAVWWLATVGTATTAAIMLIWGVRGFGVGSSFSTWMTVAMVAALITLTALRARAGFRWWEFPLVLLIVATPVCLGTRSITVTGGSFGFEPAAMFTVQSMVFLGVIAIPAAFAAGTAIAEITTSATVWASKLTARYAVRRTAITILAVLLVARLLQSAWEVRSLDPLRQNAAVIAGSAAVGLLTGLMVWAMFRHWQRRGVESVITDLPGQMSRMAMPIGAGIIAIQIPLMVLTVVIAVTGQVFGPQVTGTVVDQGIFQTLSSTAVIDTARVVLGVLLMGLALWRFRGAQPAQAALLFGAGVMLIALTARFLSGGGLPDIADATALNLTATAATIVAAMIMLARRTLTSARCAGLSALLVLSGLFAHRDVLDDPLSALLGMSGVAFILIGLIWTLLTGCAAANAGTARFPLPTRVMLILANLVFAATILAMASLVRGPDAEYATIDLKSFSDLGDLVLGTSLLIAVFVSVMMGIKRADDTFGTVRDEHAGR